MKKILITICAVVLFAASFAGCAPNNNAPNAPIIQTPVPGGNLIPGNENMQPGWDATPEFGVTPVPGTEPGIIPGAGNQQDGGTRPDMGIDDGPQGGQVTPGIVTPGPAAS